MVDRTHERWFEAELFRRKGDLLMATSAVRDAESVYRSALRVARHQGARALELRAATRLGALWLDRERSGNVARLLGPIVESFGATTDLPDLDTARTLLGQAGWNGGRSPETA